MKREPSEEKNLESKSDIKDFLIEGDILVQFNESKRNKRKIVNELNLKSNQPTRWPQGIIPFEFDSNFRKFFQVNLIMAFLDKFLKMF